MQPLVESYPPGGRGRVRCSAVLSCPRLFCVVADRRPRYRPHPIAIGVVAAAIPIALCRCRLRLVTLTPDESGPRTAAVTVPPCTPPSPTTLRLISLPRFQHSLSLSSLVHRCRRRDTLPAVLVGSSSLADRVSPDGYSCCSTASPIISSPDTPRRQRLRPPPSRADLDPTTRALAQGPLQYQ